MKRVRLQLRLFAGWLSMAWVMTLLSLALSPPMLNPIRAQSGLFIPSADPQGVTKIAQDRAQACRPSIPRDTGDGDDMSSIEAVVGLDWTQLSLNTSQLTLNLPDGTYTAVQTRRLPRSLGRDGYIWGGHLVGVEHSTVVLVVDTRKNIISGQIGLLGWRYAITPLADRQGKHLVQKIALGTGEARLSDNPSSIGLPSGLPSPSNVSSPDVSSPDVSPRADDGSQIDVLVVYTPTAVSILERVAGDVETAIEGAVAYTNQVLVDSGINTQLNLVHSQQVFYLEQPNINFDADLNNLMGKTDGYMDEVHRLRDQYRADLVVLIAGTWFASYTGNAPSPAPLNESKGFSITESCNILDETFTKQIGLNLGSSFDIANTPGGEPPIAPYGYDYQDPSTGGSDYADFVTVLAWRTGGDCPPILTSGVCPLVERFSNPLQTFNSKPLGNAANADNTRSINEQAIVVANYRDSAVALPTPTPSNTPEPTATPTPDSAPSNLVLNGGFEIDADQDKVPDFWAGNRLGAGDRVKCKGLTAYDGVCALMITGAANERSRISQTLNPDGLAIGDTLQLTGYVIGDGLTTGATLRLIARYTDDTKAKLELDIPPGTYTTYSLLQGALELEKNPKQLRIQVRYQHVAAVGKFYLDAVSIIKTNTQSPTSTPSVLSLP